MSSCQFIYNSKNTNHFEYIVQHFDECDEIFIATAFLKTSGLKLLLPAIKKYLKKNKPIHIVAGQNFGLTEPEALKILYELFQKNVNASLYLDKASSSNSVFHPKLFMFKNGNNSVIISGSANITKGGLLSNQEVSLLNKMMTSDVNWRNATKYFKKITSLDKANPISLLVIKRYEQFYATQKKARQSQKSSPNKNEFSFDYDQLKKRLRTYQNKQNKEDFKLREDDYQFAKELLDEIATSKRLSQKRFEDIIDNLVGKKGQSGLWKSGSLLRLRHEVYECKNEFIKLVQFIKNNQKSQPNKVFEEAVILVEDVSGARVNYVTEIMMTFQPYKFANLNTNPITVLKDEAGVYFKSHSSSFNGEDYQEYCLLINEIATKLDLKNMLEVDSFFNNIYWKLKEE